MLHVLSFLHNRDTKNNKLQETAKFSTRNYHIQEIKKVQHKNINMYWDYMKFTHHPVADEWYKMRESNITTSNHHYRVDQRLEKAFVPFIRLYVHVQTVFINLINNCYQIVLHQLNQDMLMLKTVTIKKYFGITTIGSS